MADKRTRALERDLEDAMEVLGALRLPSGIPRRGTVLADLLYRAREQAAPDGFPTSSASAAPALVRPSSQRALRTGPEDALRRKRGHGYSEDSSVEKAVDGLHDRRCEECGGRGWRPRADDPEKTQVCRDCGGSGEKYRDPISEAVSEIVDGLKEIARLTKVIDRKSQIVLHARDAAPAEIVAENCHGCHKKVYGGRADPIRRGLCGACARAYYLWRVDNGTNDEASDRQRFNAQRKRYEDHVEQTCDKCAELRRKAADDWRHDRGDEMRDHQRRAAS